MQMQRRKAPMRHAEKPMPDWLKIRWRERLLDAGVSVAEAARVLETTVDFVVTGDEALLQRDGRRA